MLRIFIGLFLCGICARSPVQVLKLQRHGKLSEERSVKGKRDGIRPQLLNEKIRCKLHPLPSPAPHPLSHHHHLPGQADGPANRPRELSRGLPRMCRYVFHRHGYEKIFRILPITHGGFQMVWGINRNKSESDEEVGGESLLLRGVVPGHTLPWRDIPAAQTMK